jgi:3',5'-cyclic AMP phosphodiesterase CpdA
MLIAQISDLHCRETDGGPALGCDNNRNIATAVERLNALSPRPDLVVATGDLTSSGRPAQYAALDRLLTPLEMPLYLLPGNHDELRPFLDTFAGRYGIGDDTDFVQTVIDGKSLRLVALDATVADHHNGGMPAERSEWLDATLAEQAERPTLIYAHHPPIETGIWWMDGLGILDGLDRLESVLRSHRQVVGLICGHLHRTIHASFTGIPVTVSPSTCYAVDLDIHDEAPPRVTAEPAGLMLHRWDGTTLVSHTLFLDAPHEVHDLRPFIPPWDDWVARMRRRLPIHKF